jgi:hypothetical protein
MRAITSWVAGVLVRGAEFAADAAQHRTDRLVGGRRRMPIHPVDMGDAGSAAAYGRGPEPACGEGGKVAAEQARRVGWRRAALPRRRSAPSRRYRRRGCCPSGRPWRSAARRQCPCRIARRRPAWRAPRSGLAPGGGAGIGVGGHGRGVLGVGRRPATRRGRNPRSASNPFSTGM